VTTGKRNEKNVPDALIAIMGKEGFEFVVFPCGLLLSQLASVAFQT
jgi:hypothetical protein